MEWKTKVAQYLMHPEEAISGHELLSLLGGVEINDVHKACQDRTLAYIGTLTYEDVINNFEVLKSLGV